MSRPEPQDGFDMYAEQAAFGWNEIYSDEGCDPEFEDSDADYGDYQDYLDAQEDRFTPDYYGDIDSFAWEE
jgi:hypothetical protein